MLRVALMVEVMMRCNASNTPGVLHDLGDAATILPALKILRWYASTAATVVALARRYASWCASMVAMMPNDTLQRTRGCYESCCMMARRHALNAHGVLQ